MIGIVVLAVAAVSARSVALAGFGLDSLIEIGASTAVIWELSGTSEQRQRRALQLIGYAFAALGVYLLVQSTLVLATGYHPRHSVVGIGWTAVTAGVMFALAAGKARTGRALGNPVLQTEGRVTLVDGILARPSWPGSPSMPGWAGGAPTPPPGTCWSPTRPGRHRKSSGPPLTRLSGAGGVTPAPARRSFHGQLTHLAPLTRNPLRFAGARTNRARLLAEPSSAQHPLRVVP